MERSVGRLVVLVCVAMSFGVVPRGALAAINLPPVVNVPGNQTTAASTALVFSSGGGNAITVSDPDAGATTLKASLFATSGTLTLGTTTGLTFDAGHANGTANPIATGTLVALNAALNGLSFTPRTGAMGLASVSVTVNDLGHSGTGGALQTTNAVRVWLSSIGGPAVGWGYDGYAQASGARGAGRVVQLSGGELHSLALHPDGTVSAWGHDGSGQTDVPAGLGGVCAVAAGASHSLALKTDGTVVAWGLNNYGQCDVPADLANVVAIDAGGDVSAALRADGSVVAWGYNGNGECNVPGDVSGVAAVSCGPNHILALRSDGTVAAWGGNWSGACSVPAGLAPITAVSAGSSHSLALQADGMLVGWGDGSYGATTAPTGLTGVVALAAANQSSAALKSDGTVTAWGNNGYGQASVPAGLVGATALSCGYHHVLASGAAPVNTVPGNQTTPKDTYLAFSTAKGNALSVADAEAGTNPIRVALFTTTGRLWLPTTTGLTFASNKGSSTANVIFTGTVANVNAALNGLRFYPRAGFSGQALVQLATSHTGTLTAGGPLQSVSTVRVWVDSVGGKLVAWGFNNYGQAVVPRSLSGVVQAASGYYHTVALRADGGVVAWGLDNYGQTDVPAGLGRVVQVAAASEYTLALRDDGSLAAWGNNGSGVLNVPANLGPVVAIAAGPSHCAALRGDGTVASWGDNGDGRATVPAGLGGVVALACGDAYTVALKNDGTLVAWGSNWYGQLNVPATNRGVAVAAGFYHGLVLQSSGTVAAWGYNGSGQCNVPAGLAPVSLAAGLQHSAALAADGSVTAWGYNNYGECNVPARLVGATSLGAGYEECLAAGPVPTQTAPGAQTTPVNTPLTFNAANHNGLSVADPEAGANAVKVSVYCSDGTLTLGATSGLTFAAGHASPGANPVFTGTLASVNAALSGLRYSPRQGYGGPARVTLSSSHTGTLTAAGPLQSTSTVPVWVASRGGRPVDWGQRDYGQCSPPQGLADVVQQAGGHFHTLALRADQTVVGWGYNGYGELDVPAGLSSAAAVASGVWHSLALLADGTVRAWGDNSYGQSNVPGDLTDAVALAAGSYHSLALRVDGTVVAWGNNGSGQCVVPPGLTGVVALAAGEDMSCALLNDGTVVGWGGNSYGQLSAPSGLGDAVALTAGYYHAVALRGDGSVAAWGYDGHGETDVPAGQTGVAVAAGHYHSLLLRADGTVAAWGYDSNGQVDTPPALRGAVTVAAGGYHSAASGPVPGQTAPGPQSTTINTALTFSAANGNAFAVSDPELGDGQLLAALHCSDGTLTLGSSSGLTFATGHADGSASPLFSGTVANVNAALAGLRYRPRHDYGGPATVALTTSRSGGSLNTTSIVPVWVAANGGDLVAWGYNVYGQSAPPRTLHNVVQVAGSDVSSVALRSDRTVVPWGYDGYNQNEPPSDLGQVSQLAAGVYHTLALREDGTVAAWGYNGYGECSVPAGLSGVVAVAAGSYHSLALRADGTVVAWGQNAHGESNVPAGLSGVVALAAGEDMSCALLADGTLTAWGNNHVGQATPPQLADVVALATGYYHGLALRSDGSLATWGYDAHGQTDTPAGTTAVAVAAGHYHSLALKSDGAVTAWGYNAYGQVDTPARLTGAVTLAGGGYHSLAAGPVPTVSAPVAQTAALNTSLVLSTGGHNGLAVDDPERGSDPLRVALKCTDGTLNLATTAGLTFAAGHGDGTATLVFAGSQANINAALDGLRYTPRHDFGGTAQVVLSASHSGDLAAAGPLQRARVVPVWITTRGGKPVAWGWNAHGQLDVPRGLNNVVQTAGGDVHTVVLRNDQTVGAWGYNAYGQSDVPAGLSGVRMVAAGIYHTLALRGDGTVAAWGYDAQGQVSQIPADLSDAVAVAAGSYHSLALRSDGTVVAWGYNGNGECNLPHGLTGVIALAAGEASSFALLSDGTVVGWGYNGNGQLNLPADLGDVVALASGSRHGLALRASGAVVAWGDNSNGQCDVPAGVSAVSVGAGHYHSAALRADGALSCWGYDAYGQTDPPARLTGAVTVTGGGYHTLCAGLVPDVAVPADTATSMDTPVALTGSGNFSVSAPDVGDQPIKVALMAGHGTLALSGTEGLTFADGHASPGPNPVFVGRVADVNRALASVVYQPRHLFGGADLVQLTACRRGDLSAGGPFQTSATQRVLVNSAGGVVAAWGLNENGQTSVPAALTDPATAHAVTVAGGYAHSLALLADGTVTGWGYNGYGQTTTPAGLNHAVAIAAGDYHSAALASDGTVQVWGYTNYNQGSVPNGLSDVVGLASGSSHLVALRRDGTVVAWGSNDYGQCNVPSGLCDVAAVAAGTYCTLALRSDGSLVGWGNATLPNDLGPLVGLASGDYHALALHPDGTVVAGGSNGSGECDVPADLRALALDAGRGHSLALRTDLTVASWGYNGYGEASPPADLREVSNVGAGAYHSLAVAHANTAPSHVLPASQTTPRNTPLVLGQATHNAVVVVDHDAEENPLRVNLCATNGTVTLKQTTGLTFSGTQVDGTSALAFTGTLTAIDAALDGLTFTPRAGFAGLALLQVTTNDQGNTGVGGALQATNTLRIWVAGPGAPVVAWGDNTYKQCTPPAGLNTAVAVAASQRHSLALKADGSVVAWGSNSSGQCAAPSGLNAVAVAAGYAHSLALKADGTVVAWGSNTSGQCAVPAGLSDVVAIAAGWAHSLALRGDGTVVAWGHNTYKQSSVPLTLGVASGIAAGAYHSVALRNDGTAVGWGQNGSHQVDGAAGISSAVAVAAGDTGSLALLQVGYVSGWGTLPGSDGPCLAIAAGGLHGLGLKPDGTVVAWGSNTKGESTPPAGLARVQALAAGVTHSLAVALLTPTDIALNPASVPEYLPAMSPVGMLTTVDPNPSTGFRYELVSGTGSDDNASFTLLADSLYTTAPLAPGVRKLRVRSTDSFDLTIEKALTVTVVHQNQRPVLTLPGAQTTPQDNALYFGAAWRNALSVADADAGSGALKLTLFATNGTVTLTNTTGLTFAAGHANGGGNPIATANLTNLNNALNGLAFTPRSHFGGLALLQVCVDDQGSTGTGGALTALGTIRIWVSSAGGSVTAWGDNTYAQSKPPTSLTTAVAVAGGQKHSLALKADGSVVAWGNNGSGQCSVPAGLNAVAVAAGYAHSLALKADGTVVAWGSNSNAQCTVPSWVVNAVAIAAGWSHSAALLADGTIVCWGHNAYKQSTVPTGGLPFAGLAAGGYHTLGLRHDGTVAAWGQNGSHQCDGATAVTGALAVAGSDAGSLALLNDGSVTGWGTLAGLSATRLQVAAAGGHSVCVNPDGTVTALGANAAGESTVPATLVNAVAVGAGVSHSLAIVQAPNQAPTLTVPGNQTCASGASLKLSGLVVADADAGSAAVKLSLFATNGTLNLGTTTGLTFATGHANGGANPVVTGTLSSVNAALANLTFTPRARFAGLALVQVSLDDQGNNGSGGPRLATNTVRIWVGGSGGTVTAWGDNTYGKCTPPTSLTTAVAVTGSQKHSLALKADGTVVAWGNNGSGQCSVPTGLNAVAVAAGYAHSLALRGDGTVVAWGSNSQGQCTVPAGATDVVAIAAGWAHSAALKADGTVVCWGHASYGQSTPPAGLGVVAALGAGSYHTLGVRNDGSLVAWGQNGSHQVDGCYGQGGALAVCGSDYGSLALLADASAFGWGALGGQAASRLQLAAGGSHAVALNPDGSVVCWGGTNATGENTVPTGLANVSAVGAGVSHSLAVVTLLPPTSLTLSPSTVADAQPAGTTVGTLASTDANTGVTGFTYTLVTGTGSSDNALFAISGSTLKTAAVLNGYTKPTCAIRVRSTDNLGASVEQTFNIGVTHANVAPSVRVPGDQSTSESSPLVFTGSNAISVSDVDAGSLPLRLTLFATNGTLAFGSTTGLTFAAGHANATANPLVTGTLTALNGALNGLSFIPRPKFTGLALVQVAVDDQGNSGTGGSLGALATIRVMVTSSGYGVLAWGRSSEGQCAVPTSLTSAIGVAGGVGHSLALQADGTAVAWGDNAYGQAAAGPSGTLAIAAGGYHNLALTGAGVQAWGQNTYNQTTVPATVVNVVGVAAGGYHSLALRADGTVVGWGQTSYGATTPPAGLTGVVQVAAGWRHSLALRNDGTVVAWGSNVSGESTVPTGLSGVVAVAGGQYYSLALKADGTVVGWGDASKGATAVTGSGLLQLAAGLVHSVVLKPDFTIAAFGNNGAGQTSIPAGLAGVAQVAAGGYHTLVLVPSPATLSVALTTTPLSPQRVGTNVTLVATTAPTVVPNAQYQFLVSGDGGKTKTVVRDWAAANTAPWLPGVAQTFTLYVNVRAGGATASASAAFVVSGS